MQNDIVVTIFTCNSAYVKPYNFFGVFSSEWSALMAVWLYCERNKYSFNYHDEILLIEQGKTKRSDINFVMKNIEVNNKSYFV